MILAHDEGRRDRGIQLATDEPEVWWKARIFMLVLLPVTHEQPRGGGKDSPCVRIVGTWTLQGEMEFLDDPNFAPEWYVPQPWVVDSFEVQYAGLAATPGR